MGLQPIMENKPIEFLYNPMNNYSKSNWDDGRLTMKSTWIDYTDWKRRIDEHFEQVKQLLKHQFRRKVLRLKDAMDSQWINYIKTEIRAKNLKTWEPKEAAIIHRMDE